MEKKKFGPEKNDGENFFLARKKNDDGNFKASQMMEIFFTWKKTMGDGNVMNDLVLNKIDQFECKGEEVRRRIQEEKKKLRKILIVKKFGDFIIEEEEEYRRIRGKRNWKILSVNV